MQKLVSLTFETCINHFLLNIYVSEDFRRAVTKYSQVDSSFIYPSWLKVHSDSYIKYFVGGSPAVGAALPSPSPSINVATTDNLQTSVQTSPSNHVHSQSLPNSRRAPAQSSSFSHLYSRQVTKKPRPKVCNHRVWRMEATLMTKVGIKCEWSVIWSDIASH